MSKIELAYSAMNITNMCENLTRVALGDQIVALLNEEHDPQCSNLWPTCLRAGTAMERRAATPAYHPPR